MSRFFASSVAVALSLLAFGCSSKGATPSELGSPSGAPIDGEVAPILLAPLTSAGPFERPFSARPWNDDAKQMPDEVPLEDQAGVIIAAELIGDGQSPTPPRDGASQLALSRAEERTRMRFMMTATVRGRAFIRVDSRAFPLLDGSELQSRFDRVGHLLVWPDKKSTRVLPLGALRVALSERRADVMPLESSPPKAGPAGTRLGIETRRVNLRSSLGSVELELGYVTEAGLGGPLLCRTLVELMGIEPASSPCKPGEVPLLAKYSWAEGGGFRVEVLALERHEDLAPASTVVPPVDPKWLTTGLPTARHAVFLNQRELSELRPSQVADAFLGPDAPEDGLIAENGRDIDMMLTIDGIPLLNVAPRERLNVLGVPKGRYSIQWRTVLGDRVEPARLVDCPAFVRTAP